MKRRVSTSLLIEVDLERDRGPRIAGDELVVRLHERARELRSRELFGGERREAVALRHALGGAVREDDRDAFTRALLRDARRDVRCDARLFACDRRGIGREKRRAVHRDAELERLAIDALVRRRGRRGDRARGEEDREEAEEDVGPQPSGEAEGDATGSPAPEHCLPPRDGVGGALQASGGFGETIDDALEREELALALGCALVDATLLSGHVREDRFGIGTRHVERAERGRLPEDRADLRLLQQDARLERDVGELAAQVERERQQDEDADERRVDERERSKVEEEAAAETLLPEEKERLRHELRPLREHVRVRTGREREAEPRDRDRREDEHVAQDLEHRPEARVRAGEQLRETARVDRADVALGLRRAAVVDGVGEATKQ